MKLKLKNIIFLFKILWQALRKSNNIISFDRSLKICGMIGMQNPTSMYYSLLIRSQIVTISGACLVPSHHLFVFHSTYKKLQAFEVV